ncbi:ankyrin [Elysia marginata]|uniref:Ankyrin n=1 Tax=Elysia marginata TaxID=1093978 RepID=A0AAV4JDE0_9GAST|nr:ankyrin [Elysia marginata]
MPTSPHLLPFQSCWSLSAEETTACLRMCMLMGRDDLFFRLSLKACQADTPLMVAASFGRYLLVNLLLARGADPFLENGDGLTAIETALASDYKDSEMTALRMLTAITNPTCYKSLIAVALIDRKFYVAKYLIDRGVRTTYGHKHERLWVRHSEMKQEIPLIQWWLNSFALGFYMEVLEFLLAQGLDVNVRDPSTGNTPLHLAVRRIMEPGIVELLIAHGARVNATDNNGLSPLYYTVQRNQLTNFGNLIKGGASILDSNSLFNSALVNRLFQVVLFLLHAGYPPSPANLEQLKQLGPRVPDPVQVLISSVRSEPPSLPALCAISLREALGDRLNPYLESTGCPTVVKRFIHLEHLIEMFLDQDRWGKILLWNSPLFN